MKVTVIEFPGSTGVSELELALSGFPEVELERTWHQDRRLPKCDLVILPGGHSYQDSLRPGALAKLSPACNPLRKWAKDGGRVLGIGNGFQILTELELLPGTFFPNLSGHFLNQQTCIRLERSNVAMLNGLVEKEIFSLPLCCQFGRYVLTQREQEQIAESQGIVFRYTDERGGVSEDNPFNGCTKNIAGVVSAAGNVLGILARPERAIDPLQGSVDGAKFLNAILSS